MVVSPSFAINLLDGQSTSFPLDTRLSVAEVCRVIATRTNIGPRDARLFGLAKVDKSGHFYWLEDDRMISDYFNNSKEFMICHNVRYFVDSVFDLEDVSSIELYFLEAQEQMQKGDLNLSYVNFVKCAALLLQVYAGDFHDKSNVIDVLHSLFPSPLRLSFEEKENEIENEILEQYESLKGMERGMAMIRFLQSIEKCDRYGSRFYHVKNERGENCILSLNSKGIQLYASMKDNQPNKIFSWNVLDNLYYRNQEFSIEVRESSRMLQSSSSGGMSSFLDITTEADEELAKAVNDPTTQVSLSRRSVASNRPQTLSFVCDSNSLCKAIWTAAINQHQFFLDEKSKRSQNRNGLDHRELNDKLNRLISKSSIGSSLPSLSSLHSTTSPPIGNMPAAKVSDGSSLSLPSLKSPPNMKSDEDRAKDLEIYNKLKSKRTMLEEKLVERMKELLSVCLKEQEITGEVPKEIKKALFPGQEIPKPQKRVGTSFSIPEELIRGDRKDKMVEMVTDVELHRKIVAAAERLAKDKSMNKSVRKKRRKDYQAAAQKLKGLEIGLNQMRLSASKPDISSLASNGSESSWSAFPSSNGPLTRAMAKSCPTTPRGSVPDLHAENAEKSEFEDDEPVPRRAPSVASRRSLAQRHSEASSSSSSMGLSCSDKRRSLTQRSITSDELDNPLISPIYENVGYRSTSYRSSYRQAHYPTIQDEQHISRKRAVSAHALTHSGKDRTDGQKYNVTVQRIRDNQSTPIRKPSVDQDVTLTSDHPIRRLPTSISCSAGFTSSLDRRSGSTPRHSAPRDSRRDSQVPSRGASPATHRITTFPVSNSNSSFDTPTALPRFQAPLGRLSHFPPRGPLPPYQGNQSINQSISSSRLPVNTDPQMEALLDYYKAEARKSTPKTATIV